MDERSFRLNFELTTILYDPAWPRAVCGLRGAAGKSRRIKAESLKGLGFAETLKIGLARMASPLL